MPTTQLAVGRVFTYLNNLGRISRTGPGFRHPVGLGRGAGDVLYVANWGDEFQPNARITKCNLTTQEWLKDIGMAGSGEGQFLWPGGLAVDGDENLYVTDQAAHKIVIFDKEGAFLGKWGDAGSKAGQLNKPSGIEFDNEGNLYVVDTRNNRVQKFTQEGKFLAAFGQEGRSEGQFRMPWGVTVDKQGDVYVADWGNDRVQKFSPEGRYLATLGRPGSGKGELSHPADVAVDRDGDVYVADWGNERVVIFAADGDYVHTIVGDATNLSAWGEALVMASPALQQARARVDLEPEWRLRRPAAIHVGADYKILIAEAQHMRVQVYLKDVKYTEVQFNL